MPGYSIRTIACGALLAGSTFTVYARPVGASSAPAAAAFAQSATPAQTSTPAPAGQHPGITPAKARIGELAWIAGAWTGMLGERTIEQHWSAPLAGSIVAMYRSIQGGRPTLYELLAIEQEGEGLVLRIKHFTPGQGLVGQEAKDQSNDNTLVSIDGKTATFQGGSADSPVQIRFNSPDPDALNITVTRQRSGAPAATEFKYRRIKP